MPEPRYYYDPHDPIHEDAHRAYRDELGAERSRSFIGGSATIPFVGPGPGIIIGGGAFEEGELSGRHHRGADRRAFERFDEILRDNPELRDRTYRPRTFSPEPYHGCPVWRGGGCYDYYRGR